MNVVVHFLQCKDTTIVNIVNSSDLSTFLLLGLYKGLVQYIIKPSCLNESQSGKVIKTHTVGLVKRVKCSYLKKKKK